MGVVRNPCVGVVATVVIDSGCASADVEVKYDTATLSIPMIRSSKVQQQGLSFP